MSAAERFPDEVASLLTELPPGLHRLLGDNLVGVYVYGSVLEHTFDPSRSDIDGLVVTREALNDGEIDALAGWLRTYAARDPWVNTLQLSFLIEGTVLADDPRACLYQFGRLTRSGSDGNPIVWLDCLRRGATLFGPAPESFLPPITPAMFHDALIREAEYLREELLLKDSEWRDEPSYRTYAVLTLCRLLYSQATGTVTSKPQAAEWVLRETRFEWHDLVRVALGGDRQETGDVPLPALQAFVEYVRDELRSADAGHGGSEG